MDISKLPPGTDITVGGLTVTTPEPKKNIPLSRALSRVAIDTSTKESKTEDGVKKSIPTPSVDLKEASIVMHDMLNNTEVEGDVKTQAWEDFTSVYGNDGKAAVADLAKAKTDTTKAKTDTIKAKADERAFYNLMNEEGVDQEVINDAIDSFEEEYGAGSAREVMDRLSN